MEFIPIDFAPEDHMWAHECQMVLESALQLARQKSGLNAVDGFRWPEPPDALAPLLIGQLLLDVESSGEAFLSDSGSRAILEQAVAAVANWLLALVRPDSNATMLSIQYPPEESLAPMLAASMSAQLYTQFRKYALKGSEGRLLQSLLANRVPAALAVGVDLLVAQPPHDWSEASLAISALVQSTHWQLSDVFPKLFDATDPSVLAPALDLANLLVRERGVTPHPAAERFDRMLTLLGGVTQQLANLEEDPSRYSTSVAEVQRILFDGVSLAVSLCHFFAMQGDPAAIAKLTQALTLNHRRIKTEAAFALAKLGEDRAIDLLLELVEDDSCRPRVLAYGRELGIESRIDPEWTSSLSNARSQLALRLSQPDQFSLAPQRIEKMDQRTLPWPGFEEPQECFLLRFHYDLGNVQYSNVGFAGPMAHAFSFEAPSNLTHEDWYAMFLAHDVDDSGETHTAWPNLTPTQLHQAEEWVDRLTTIGYDNIEPMVFIEFMGQQVLLAAANDPTGQACRVAWDDILLLRTAPSPQAWEILALRWKGRIGLELLGVVLDEAS